MPDEPADLGALRDCIATVAPDVAHLPLTMIEDGWDSQAVDAGGEWIFKFPRGPEAAERLRREARLLALVRRHVSLTVPDMVLHEAPTTFSRHRKIPGRSLEASDYTMLDEPAREALAEVLGRFYAELHAIPVAEAELAGAAPFPEWLPAQEILGRLRRTLPTHLTGFLEQTMDRWMALTGDDSIVFGYFDGHGWNMAFDDESGRLNGCYDFADAGLGARHKDLTFTTWIAQDLTLRIIARYERLTGLTIDRDRVMLHSAMLRLHELAVGFGDRAERLRAVEDWVRGS